MGAVEKFLLIVLVAWIVWRVFGRRVVNRQTRDTTDRANRTAGPTSPPRPIEDMVKCPKCGAYVAAGGNHRCEG